MKKSKRIISLLLSFIMLLSITAGYSISAFADDYEFPDLELSITFDAYTYNYWSNGQSDIIMEPSYTGKEVVIPSEVEGHIADIVWGRDSYANHDGDNYSVEKITLPNTITKIGGYAFTGYRELKNIDIPEKCTHIGMSAFQSCTSLVSFVVPKSIEKVELLAFNECENLQVITFLNKNCIIGDMDNIFNELTVDENAAICGYKNSTAEEYASKYNRDFVALDDIIIADGTDSEYTIGSENGASIHCAYPLDEFVSVSVNGNIVDESNYTLEEGSTILTFKPSYLNTLKAGEYAVTLNYTMGAVETALTIIDNAVTPSENPTVKPSEPATEVPTENVDNTITATTTASTETTNSSEKSPSTGYDYLSALTFVIAVVSGIGSVVCFVSSRKKCEEK